MKHTKTKLGSPVQCNFCDRTAEYDGRTIYGPWAYMCKAHYQMYGVGLGLGKGQRIEYEKGNV